MKRFLVVVMAVLCVMCATAQVKYVFYMIGDGMGPNQVLSAEMYQAELQGKIGREKLCMTQFPVSGQLSTYSTSNGITDSSAAGTCLASGKKTNNGTLGLDDLNKPVETIAEILRDKGWSIGIMTSVSIDHATPGAFYAHVNKRSEYYKIGKQLAESKFDFFGGSSFLHPTDKDDASAPNLYKLCEEAGYHFAHGYKEYEEVAGTERVILIQSHEGQDITQPSEGMIPYALDKTPEDLTLPQITSAAIDFLSRKQKPFFMMVEGGAIDWACHSNDAATVIGEVQEFDKAIQVVYDFYKKHPKETLIIITADHETGGMALGNKKYTLDLQLLQNQKVSVGKLSDEIKALQEQYGKKLKWEQVKDLLQKEVGLYDAVPVKSEEDAELQQLFEHMLNNKAKDEKTLYAEVSALAAKAIKLLNKKAHVGWTTTSHSAAAVPVFAIGQGAELFTGWHDNSEVMPLILKAAN
ncbi:MAG: alkaline phosphatase [Paludibacteraceae bacterium]|nr:alkaline phosphatase [Paludibacteraceae bacterium]